MTDTDKVIKELQSASEWFTEHGRNTNTAIVGICDRAVDLINRQRAEIERLTSIHDKLALEVSDIAHINVTEYEKIRAEAVKEFAERLKYTKIKLGNEYVIYADNIGVIVQEMVGEQG